MELRRFRKPTTIIEGINPKNNNLHDIAKKLKTWCACGGSAKNGVIILQGDHREIMVEYLGRFGFPSDSIEVL